MTQALALKGSDRVLEIGTGSGYGAAVLSRIAAQVISIERHAALARTAARLFEQLGYSNLKVIHADGTRGWPPQAPYDAICVTAAANQVPEPLLWQLAAGGRLVIPVGGEGAQSLVRVTRERDGAFVSEDLGPVRFVPLVKGEGSGESR